MKNAIKFLIFLSIFFFSVSIQAQGPVIISGLDTEWGYRNWPTGPATSGPFPRRNSHGDLQMWADVIQTGILNNVTLNPSGPILVIGGGKSPTDEMTSFWNKIATNGLGRSAVYSNSSTGDILTIPFTGYSMIAICNTVAGTGKLTLAELNDISSRQAEIATFVNSGGGLFASACDIGTPPYGYINIGTPPLTSANQSCSNSTPTTEGTAMGIPSIEGPFHTYFTQFPTFLNVLSTCGGNDVILGGSDIMIPEPPTPYCCPGENLVINGDFEAGDSGFDSDFTSSTSPIALSSIVPGQYGVVNGSEAAIISPSWDIENSAPCLNASGRFLIVNGENAGGSIPPSKVMWEQTIEVEDWKGYKFCMKAKNLNQCGFNVDPKIEVQFSMPVGNINETISISSSPCKWQEISKHLNLWGYGDKLTIKIVLDQSEFGDGNDIAIDDISLIQLPKMGDEFAVFGYTPVQTGSGLWNITVHAAIPLPDSCDGTWTIKAIEKATGKEDEIYNASQWWSTPTYKNTTNFPGYDGTSIPTTVSNSSSPGVFDLSKFSYLISHGVYCECQSWNQWTIKLNY